MVDKELLKVYVLEEQYPFLTESQFDAICNNTDSLNEAAYLACMMKSKSDKIKVGPIEIVNDTSFWNSMADSFYLKWQQEDTGNNIGKSKSLTGMCVGRADEY